MNGKNLELLKVKNIYDHLTAIRTTKDPLYYTNLTDKEKKGFNHWLILNWLSMDIKLIPFISEIWKDGYYDVIPSNAFYKLLCQEIPKSFDKLFYIKKLTKQNKTLVNHISNWYSVSIREAECYYNTLMMSDDGMLTLVNILEGIGLSDIEAEQLLNEK